jgi:ABC-2 type transport system ATP-binding protein
MILQLKQVSKSFGSHQVLDDISFELKKPQIIGLVAPNGYGKTTLFNIISNLEKPDSGEIMVFSKKNTSEEIYENLAYLQDNRVLYNNLTAREHLAFVAACHNVERQELIKVCDRLGMSHYLDKRVKQYSLGMKQHLLLAIALISQPQLLLLDEPLNGLDPSSVKLFREIMTEMYTNGVSIIISSHNLYEIEKLTSNILFLHDHKLIRNTEIDVPVDYLYLLSDIRKIETLLTENGFFWEVKNPVESLFTLNEHQKEKFEEICQSNGVLIYDCIQKISKTEAAYFSLFTSHNGD